ncbi:hypothetical protein LQ327_09480 [Actinomycetospora endophytica]|uniref:Protein kinase domain-containing protein n=1 Tax=Actinomycetospora endophytica TaxID=2291215 RepID=A0ABS8P5U8_9PSEU|nr:hypothetical protein [Actinomycetospora endophytica]MCD2193611.1 hypothetical protein [Actinomycetospora endophytica]
MTIAHATSPDIISPHANEIRRSELGELGDELGRGGQARVVALSQLRLPDVPGPLVFKEYKPGHAPAHGLTGIVALRNTLTPARRAALDACTVWPVRVVRDGPEIVGVVMPLIGDGFLQQRALPSGRVERAPREVQNLFVDPDLATRIGMPLMPLEARLTVCRDLAAALAVLHDLGVVFGDINAKNALFRRANAASVLLVDTDAVRVRGSSAVVRQLNSPDWEPPEGEILSQATDVYKFGLFLLRTLSPSAQASVARDATRAAALLEGTGRTLLDLTLHPDPAERPSAAHWANYLSERVAALRGWANGHRDPQERQHTAAAQATGAGQRQDDKGVSVVAQRPAPADRPNALPVGAGANVFPLRPTTPTTPHDAAPQTAGSCEPAANDGTPPVLVTTGASRGRHSATSDADDSGAPARADIGSAETPSPSVPVSSGRHARPSS